MIEIVTCRCCATTQERVYGGRVAVPGCRCSGFWCVISAKCVAHCPGLLSADHVCNSDDCVSYGRTFLYDYRTDADVGGEKEGEKVQEIFYLRDQNRALFKLVAESKVENRRLVKRLEKNRP